MIVSATQPAPTSKTPRLAQKLRDISTTTT